MDGPARHFHLCESLSRFLVHVVMQYVLWFSSKDLLVVRREKQNQWEHLSPMEYHLNNRAFGK